MVLMTPELESFLRELAALSKRTGFWINGCGECGSPWIQTDDPYPNYGIAANCLFPTEERDGYEVGGGDEETYFDKTIVRLEAGQT
jgi:hypothetical protein